MMESPTIMHKMEGLRRSRDRSYKNVFKGSVLVSTLMDHDKSKFASRDAAVKFAQRLLDAGHIESIVGSKNFEDSVHLYRWSDESLVRDARRMVSTTSHIPRKRLIELIDLQQGGDAGADNNNNSNNTSNGYHVKDVQDRIIAQAEQAIDRTDRNVKEVQAERAVRSRERRRRRQTLDSTQLAESSGSLFNQTDKTKDGGDLESNLLRSSSMSSETLSSSSLKVRPTSPNGSCKSSEVEGTKSSGSEPRQRSRAARDAEKAKLTSQDGTPSPERVRSPVGSSSSTSKVEERVKSPVSSLGDERVRPSIPAPSTPDDKSSRSIHDERVKSPMTTTDADDKLKSLVSTSWSIEDRVRSPQPNRTEESPRVLSPVTTKDTPSTDEEKKEKEGVSTCRYDGVDMPALDIENYDLTHHRNRPSTNKSLEDLAEQSYSYSDNEKQLLEEMKRMQQEHDTAVAQYEEKILDLMSTMTDLRKLADELARNKNKSDTKVSEDSGLSLLPLATVPASAPRPPAPPPPPPPLMMHRILKPSKPEIKPRVKMRPLFWSRIVMDENTRAKFMDGNFWQSATEPNFDVDEFERLFGKNTDKQSAKVKSLHDALSSAKGKGKKQTAKILDETRSRAVAIKLRSLHCQMDDVRQAVYKMDFSKIDLDSLYSLFEIRGEPDELDKIKVHIQDNEDVPLDQPEQFLLELSQMSHLPERMECMIFKKRFNESLFTIDQQLTTVQNAIDEVKKSERLHTVLEFILAFGNYMNGGTQRGQADGFDLSILPKLNDVKSMDNHLTLLQYIVRVYTKEHEPDAGRTEAVFRLPESGQINMAATVSFADLEKELAELQHQLQTRKKMTELVCMDTEESLLQPFKDQMEDFFESSDDMLKHQKEQTAETKGKFQEFLQFMAIKDVTEQVTPEWFFGLWATFLDDYRRCWELEQNRFARLMFEKVEQKRKDRIRQAKRRKSNMDPDKAGLKQKFSHRRRSDVSQTVKLLRSMSASAALDQEEDNDDRPRRRRRPHTDDMSDTGDVISFRVAPEGKPRDPNKPETMAEKVHRRRAIRMSSEETPSLSRADSRESLSSVASSTAPSLNVIRRVRARHMSEDLRHLMPSTTERYDTDSDLDARFRRRRRAGDVDENVHPVNEQNLPDEAKGDENRRRRIGRDESLENVTIDASQTRRRDGAKLNNTRGHYHSQEDILENGGRKSPSPPPRPNLPAGYSNASPRVRPQLRSDDLEGTDLDSQPRQYRDALRRMSRSRSNSANIEQLINGPMKVQWKQDRGPTSLQQRIRSRSNTQELSPTSMSLPQYPESSHPIRRRQSREDDHGSRRTRQFREQAGESNI